MIMSFLIHEKRILHNDWVTHESLNLIATLLICFKRVSIGSKDSTKELKPECAYFLGQIS